MEDENLLLVDLVNELSKRSPDEWARCEIIGKESTSHPIKHYQWYNNYYRYYTNLDMTLTAVLELDEIKYYSKPEIIRDGGIRIVTPKFLRSEIIYRIKILEAESLVKSFQRKIELDKYNKIEDSNGSLAIQSLYQDVDNNYDYSRCLNNEIHNNALRKLIQLINDG
jgi:hypothetical protein